MSRCWNSPLWSALLVTAALALGSPAAAAERRDGPPAISFDALVEQGLVAYRARDYRVAAEKFLQANAMQPDPNLLFNVARCYEALGDTRGAVEKYRLFLASPDIEPGGRQRAEERLRILRRAAAPGTTAADSPEATTETEAAPRRSALPVFGAVVGAAGVLAGGLAYALGVRDQRQVTGVPEYGTPGAVHPLTEVQAHQLIDAGQRKKTIGAVLVGASGAILAASLAALVRTSPAAVESGSLAVAVTPGGLSLGGRF